MDKGVYGSRIEDLGIEVNYLNINIRNALPSLLKAKGICKNTDIINTWLYHADIFGFVIAKLLLRKKLIWNIRHSNLDKDANKSLTLRIVKINSYLSKYVDHVTYNSYKALDNHLKIGYLEKNLKVIPNGFELDEFKFEPDARQRVRRELGLKENCRAVITVGRWDVQKDYYTLFKSLNVLRGTEIKYKMIMVGANLDCTNDELISLIKRYDLKDKVILLGRRDDIPALLSAADIYISPSLGESFSNAIGEAMACELPCIVTDVGDSKIIVGDTGTVVPVKDYKKMACEMLNHINRPDLSRNTTARKKIMDNYEIKRVTEIFEQNFDEVVFRHCN